MIPMKIGGMFLKNASFSITFAKILTNNGRFFKIQGVRTDADPCCSGVQAQ